LADSESRGVWLRITPHSREGRGKNGQGAVAAPHPFTGCDHRQGVFPAGPVQGRREFQTLGERPCKIAAHPCADVRKKSHISNVIYSKEVLCVSRKIFIYIIIASIANILFLLFYKENLHCDQYSSFELAIFEMTPHAEEAELLQVPLTYNHVIGIPIRIYSALSILLILFLPISLAILYFKSRIKKRTFIVLTLIITLISFINIFVPFNIFGERIMALNTITFGYGLIGNIILQLVVIFAKQAATR